MKSYWSHLVEIRLRSGSRDENQLELLIKKSINSEKLTGNIVTFPDIVWSDDHSRDQQYSWNDIGLQVLGMFD